jgi:adenylosuccinate synthase
MTAYAIVGLQFGSEGKGALAGYLAAKRRPEVCMVNWSPNAGHTFRIAETGKLVVRMLPIGAYVSPLCRDVLIGPGAILDLAQLANEFDRLPPDVRVTIHPAAAVVVEEDLVTESAYVRIGSTMKGSAAASIRRMNRDPGNVAVVGQMKNTIEEVFRGKIKVDDEEYYRVLFGAMNRNATIQIEGCQGYSLSMYHGMYPYVTSRDTTVSQLLADIGWPYYEPVEVYGCIRTYPIRVANRGEAGTSGPGYPDQIELTWEQMGVEPELTTVTHLPRRIFTFSHEQVKRACRINGVKYLYLSFCDYIERREDWRLLELIRKIEQETHARVKWQSWGPLLADMQEIQGI